MPTVEWFGSKLDAELSGPNGVVAGDLVRRGLKVTNKAKQLVGVRTGRLRSSIRGRMGRDSRGLVYVVGTDVSYALMHHDGTRPHIIRPKTKRVLYWKGARHPVREVHHPGTKGTKFLTRALEAGD